MKRIFLLIAGHLALCIGVIGIILPVIPTTPLLLLAGFCFAQSSEKFEIWLKGTKVYKFYVSDYAETKAISKDRKKRIAPQIWLLMAISIWLAPIKGVKIMLACLTLFITWYLFFKIPDK